MWLERGDYMDTLEPDQRDREKLTKEFVPDALQICEQRNKDAASLLEAS